MSSLWKIYDDFELAKKRDVSPLLMFNPYSPYAYLVKPWRVGD